jgi:hypothetical protein
MYVHTYRTLGACIHREAEKKPGIATNGPRHSPFLRSLLLVGIGASSGGVKSRRTGYQANRMSTLSGTDRCWGLRRDTLWVRTNRSRVVGNCQPRHGGLHIITLPAVISRHSRTSNAVDLVVLSMLMEGEGPLLGEAVHARFGDHLLQSPFRPIKALPVTDRVWG